MKKVKRIVLAAIVFSMAMGLLTPALAKGKNTYWLKLLRPDRGVCKE